MPKSVDQDTRKAFIYMVNKGLQGCGANASTRSTEAFGCRQAPTSPPCSGNGQLPPLQPRAHRVAHLIIGKMLILVHSRTLDKKKKGSWEEQRRATKDKKRTTKTFLNFFMLCIYRKYNFDSG
jgi:hypothetical protein